VTPSPGSGCHEPHRAAYDEYVSAGRAVIVACSARTRAWRCAAGVPDMLADDFVIVHLDGMYTLVSPDGTQEVQFQDYVVPSSAAWRVVVRQLELWLEQMKNDSGGQ
jgi:hypothetical protein